MGDGKGKWFQFEEGLQQSECLENKLANINENSYKQFHEEYVNQKLAKERRAILIFLGTNSDKRKKGKHIDMDKHSAEQLLIQSIMNSCTRSEVGKGELLTAAVVRCEDKDIVDAAYIKGKEIKEKKNISQIDSAKKFLDKGGRIVDNKGISLWGKYELIDKDIRETANSHPQKWLSIVFRVLIQNWVYIISVLYFFTRKWQEVVEGPCKYVLLIFGIIYFIVFENIKWAMKEAGEEVRKEIRYYRNLDYPVIFYNRAEKEKRWMKKYIQEYMRGEEEEETKESVFYIGANNSKLEEEKIHKFIIPKGHPEWGLICLCKLMRELADNPWGEIWPDTAITDIVKSELVFNPSLEAYEEQNNSDPQLYIFKMPRDEKKLRDEIEKKENWHFARDPSSKDSKSRLFPIGNSVYAIRRNISWSDFRGEVIGLQRKIAPEIGTFATPISYQFWLIQVVENELEVIEKLNMISGMPIWDNDLWGDTWQNIIQLIENFQNVKINELCEIVWDEKKASYSMSFADFKKSLENIQKENVITLISRKARILR